MHTQVVSQYINKLTNIEAYEMNYLHRGTSKYVNTEVVINVDVPLISMKIFLL